MESYVVALNFNPTNSDVRYLLLYTRGDLVGQPLGMRGDLGTFKIGLFRLRRSLEAKIEVETR